MAKAKPTTTANAKDSPSAKRLKPIRVTGDQLLPQLKAVQSALQSGERAPIAELLKRSELRSPLVIASPHHTRVRRLISWIKENLYKDHVSGIGSYFASDLGSESALNHLRSALTSASLFAPQQLVLLYEVDKLRAASLKSLLDALERTDPSVLVIATASDAAKSAPIAAIGTAVELTDLQGPQLRRWIEREIQRMGSYAGRSMRIAEDAVDVLVRCYGSDIEALAPELEKLTLVTPLGGEINRSLVERLSLRTGEVTSFELVRHMARKNLASATGLAAELVTQGMHPLQISVFLSKCFRVLLAHAGPTPSPLPSELGNQWFVRQLGNAGQAFSAEELLGSLEVLSHLDFQLKDSKLPPDVALSLAVVKITNRSVAASC